MTPDPRDTVLNCITTMFPGHTAPLTDETKASEVSGWDSVSHVQLMFLIEEESSRMLDIGATFALPDVGALVAYVASCPPA